MWSCLGTYVAVVPVYPIEPFFLPWFMLIRQMAPNSEPPNFLP